MQITCPACGVLATLEHARRAWIVGEVIEIDADGTCLMTTDDTEEMPTEQQYQCGDCGVPLTVEQVLAFKE